MEKIVKTKIPVDYVKDKEGHDTLMYRMIETLESNVSKYRQDNIKIEDIFTNVNNDYHIIAKKLKKMIEQSFTDTYQLKLLMDYEWMLRFAYKSDLALLLTNPDFIAIKENVKVPYDAYLSNDYNTLFTKIVKVPLWEKRKINYQSSIIEWLVTDKHNNFQERLSALLLGDFTLAQEILTKNEWLLMFVDEQERIDIMNQCKISMTSANKVIGYNHEKTLRKVKMTIPINLSDKYHLMEQEIKKIIEQPNLDETLINYAYSHSSHNNITDDNYLLREHLWLLELVDAHTQHQLMQILNINGYDNKKKYMITVTPNLANKQFNLYHMPVSYSNYDKYHELNEQLFALISKEHFSLRELDNFIQSSPLTLIIWPWLNNYELLQSMSIVSKVK